MGRLVHRMLVAGAILTAPLPADTLRLVNGNSFEGVITAIDEESVEIRLAYGELVLPRRLVREVERADSPLGEFFERFDALSRDATGSGRDWLRLALWARQHGLDHGAAEAAKTAADLEPLLEGLAPLMRALGYVLDHELGIWLTRDELMRRQGFVESEGRWVSREELAARERAREEEARDHRDRERQDRLAQVVELLALSQIESLREDREPQPQVVGLPLGGVPMALLPGGWAGGGFYFPDDRGAFAGAAPPGRHRAGGSSTATARELLRRQAGSIIPLSPTGGSRVRGRAD